MCDFVWLRSDFSANHTSHVNMEFGERKRRRKSQSFKLVTDEASDSSYMKSSSSGCKDAIRPPSYSTVPDVWVGDESMEIKRQITGMMRLLSDRTGRTYQRVATERDCLTMDPQDRHLTWAQQPAPIAFGSEDHQSNNWNSAEDPGPSPSSVAAPVPNGPGCGRYSACSKATRMHNTTKDLIKVSEAKGRRLAGVGPPTVPESPCCMCNCKGTLQAILREMRAMRRLMQTQKACFERAEQAASQPRLGSGFAPRCRQRRRRPIYKVTPLGVTSCRRDAHATPEASLLNAAAAESGQKEECEKQESSTPGSVSVSSGMSVLSLHDQPVNIINTPNSDLTQQREPQVPESEVRLAEDYDVFISKTQLDSILVNYTRSGSLLFRKLVCAFFDDATLANSLPNGKRKRGLNDNRKGLDQNIVGAIKVFTEKYCTEHRIEKLPGPRDWVQILQDQIKLARRRLKRDAAEVEEGQNGVSTNYDHKKPTDMKGTVVNMMA